jgi:hypothetical protein
MKSVVSTPAKSALLGRSGLVRAAIAISITAASSAGSIGLSGFGSLGAFGLEITASTPAQARCLIGGAMRNDIADNDCLEAQRTGCVRHMLTPDQYRNCLQANEAANASGRQCIIGGIIHAELSAEDCAEGKATGCVRRLLTPAQYADCLSKQHH